jgi:hypothetical protein
MAVRHISSVTVTQFIGNMNDLPRGIINERSSRQERRVLLKVARLKTEPGDNKCVGGNQLT